MVKSLCRLAQEKPFSKITVREITEGADVSRGAFYIHFTDIYDMYDQIENQVIENLTAYFQIYADTLEESDYEQMLVNIIQYIETDKPLFQMLFSMQSFRSRFTALLKEFDETIWKIYSGREISSDLWDYLITYHIQGILACLDQWLSRNPPFSHYDLIRMLTLLDNAFDDLVEEHCCNKQT